MNVRPSLFAVFALLATISPCTPLGAQTLSLDDALRIGEAQAPRLTAQRYAIGSADHKVARAGELPDPRLKLGLENLPVSGSSRFRYDTDFMTQRTVGIAQEIPSEAKRAARSERATRQREFEQANFAAQRAQLQREIAVAWLDSHYAERARDVLLRLADQYRLQSDAAPSAIARGRQSAADGYALRTAFEQANDRIIEQERTLAKARIALAAFVGEEAKRPLAVPPDTAVFDHPREHLLDRVAEHSAQRVFDFREALARADV